MSLPWETVLRVWDMFLLDGPKALFRAGMSILVLGKQLILSCSTSSDIIQVVLQLGRNCTNSNEFIKHCLKWKLSRKELEQVREYVMVKHQLVLNK
jgi:hypothetical protein